MVPRIAGRANVGMYIHRLIEQVAFLVINFPAPHAIRFATGSAVRIGFIVRIFVLNQFGF